MTAVTGAGPVHVETTAFLYAPSGELTDEMPVELWWWPGDPLSVRVLFPANGAGEEWWLCRDDLFMATKGWVGRRDALRMWPATVGSARFVRLQFPRCPAVSVPEVSVTTLLDVADEVGKLPIDPVRGDPLESYRWDVWAGELWKVRHPS